MPTRRRFLLDCTAAALTLAMAPAVALGASVSSRETAADGLSLAAFRDCLETQFRVSTDAGTSVELVLIKAEEKTSKRAGLRDKDADNEKFRLVFQGPDGAPLEQNTYFFENSKLGRFAMFITPIRRKNTDNKFYEAVFNRPPANSRR